MAMTFFRELIPAMVLAAGLFASAAHAATFRGVVTHVTDGDSIWVRPDSGGQPLQIRLRGVDAPEICQHFGQQARDALAVLALHRQVTVKTRARDSYQRILGQVQLGHEDLAAWLVARGYAWSHGYRGRGGPYQALQEQARSARLGLWRAGHHPVEPRLFRKQHGSCTK